MKILICKQGIFGGTDKLLERYYIWLSERQVQVGIADIRHNILPSKKIKYDLALIPSSQMGDLIFLKKKGYQIERVLIWILGMGAFRDSYVNSSRNNYPIEKWVNHYISKKADNALKCMWKSKSMIFTDEVGAYNTFRGTDINYKKGLEDNLIPIAIPIPNDFLERCSFNCRRTLHISWIGRVSEDFKLIPLKHLIDDIDCYVRKSGVDIDLVIVGDGDAIDEVKKYSENREYAIKFIPNIAYEKLNEFVNEQTDLLIAMGTSALDGAKVGCPTVIINPIRKTDPDNCYYRWIHESKGYSLGEFSGIEVDQEQKKFEQIMSEYFELSDLGQKAYNYAKEFDSDHVFDKLSHRILPDKISKEMWKDLKFYYRLVHIKTIVKKYKA